MYNYEWVKKGVGLRLIEIVIHINIVNIYLDLFQLQFQVIQIQLKLNFKMIMFKLLKIYVIILLLMINEKLTKEILEVNQLKDKNSNNVKIILMYNFVKIALDEIVENMNSENYYQIKFLTILIEKIYQ